jgi:catechol 2,3-dioxygenase-like lactoylglutathione lyase family enzyme
MSSDSPLSVSGFDHLVLRCADVEKTLDFYISTLGLRPENVDEWRDGTAFFPSARISDEAIIDFIPAAGTVTEKNVDHVCMITTRAVIDTVAADRERYRVADGPDYRSGARRVGWSIYVLDPDDNLVELKTYDDVPAAE